MKKITLTLTALVLGIFLTTTAFAWGGGPGRGGRDCKPYGEARLDRLDLTDAQEVNIEKLRDAHDKATKALREKIFDQSVALKRLWQEVTPDKAKITAAQKELREMRAQMEDHITTLRLEIRKLLTPEQNEKLANMGWSKRGGFGPRGGMRGPGEFGPGRGPCPGMDTRR